MNQHTDLHYLVGCVCVVAVQESIVDHVTCPLPIERQLDHLHWRNSCLLGETVQ